MLANCVKMRPALTSILSRRRPKGVRVGAYIDYGRDCRADDRASSFRDQDQMTPRCDQLDDLGIVGDVGKAVTHVTVRHDVHQIETWLSRIPSGLDQSVDRSCARLGGGAERFFFLSCQAAIGISGRKAAIVKDGVISDDRRGLQTSGRSVNCRPSRRFAQRCGGQTTPQPD